MSTPSPWWLAVIGDMLVWARVDITESGVVEILDAGGQALRYDDETAARMALLDAEFRALDGLDEADAAMLGLDLASLVPPRGDSMEVLLPQMTHKLVRRDN